MEEIMKLIKELPSKDLVLAEKLLSERDFSELSLLVHSDIVKVERAQRKRDCSPEYADIRLDKLFILKTKVDNYNLDSLYG